MQSDDKNKLSNMPHNLSMNVFVSRIKCELDILKIFTKHRVQYIFNNNVLF